MTGLVRVFDPSSCSFIEADRERMGEVGSNIGRLTNESRGLPSSSGSGRDPNRELLDADLPLPPVVNRSELVSDPLGDIMKPAGEYPPDLARLFVSTIELFENCLVTDGGSGEDSSEDLRLSFRFCSECSSRIASSIEEVMLNCSAVRSRCCMLPV